MNLTIAAYIIYLPLTISLSIWVAKSLHKNTQVFLLERFNHNVPFASSTNNLIQTGFYLIALGYSFMKMIITNGTENTGVYTRLVYPQQVFEVLASKVGAFTLILGILLFLNFFIMLKIQKPKQQIKQTPPFIIEEDNDSTY